uniref:Uncharacterized protein n=1 Tax=Cannabis sativa TaxID=3483 RepID=A0A803P6M8_CANSA
MAGPGRLGSRNQKESAITRVVNSVFGFVKMAEFEILFVLFFVIAFLIFKDLKYSPDQHQGGELQTSNHSSPSNISTSHAAKCANSKPTVPPPTLSIDQCFTLVWKRQSVGKMKLNTDAAILGNEKKLGLGAKLCDHEAMVLVLVVWPSSSNFAPDVSETLFHSQRD